MNKPLYMRKIIGSSALTAAILALPALASAATLLDTLALANTFLNALIGLFITLAIVVFFWGLIKYRHGLYLGHHPPSAEHLQGNLDRSCDPERHPDKYWRWQRRWVLLIVSLVMDVGAH